jgi:hypothetical protein
MHLTNPLDVDQGLASIPAGETLQDYSQVDHQIEALGQRLDHVRGVMARIKATDTWKYTYWKCVEARVLKKWQMMDLLRQTRLRTSYKETLKVDYAWWEPHVGMALNNTFLWNLGLPARLEWSWENAREEFIQKARRGLA